MIAVVPQSRETKPRPRFCIFVHLTREVRPVDHFAAFCETLTQSEDRWKGQPLKA